ncbi:hypothetical protein EIL87_12785 [Saccharopolyspora rhizosphaerae]|uniref:Uncharacterized protein n=1 Tax=Saccharopolyspora rhizosphaerae TaxID=2492662 RepID=A0A426JU16_9PSEU|nr:hypothetical protein [Saccharopolyspora rhizosphaerae]RRO16690.1 hypothetical protein EIL87_12785 [Saccharopolyspora rhizosphaerae]
MAHARTLTLAAALLSITAAAGCGSGAGWFDTDQARFGQYAPQMPQQTVTETAPETVTESPSYDDEPQYQSQSDHTPPVSTTDCFATYQTTESRVQLCEVGGQTYYYGSSAVGSIMLAAYQSGYGTYRTEVNDGYAYTINDHELVVTRNGSVVSEQPVTYASN